VETERVLGGRYRLEEPLGRGGMSVVWRARDEVLGRSVAVKLLAGRYASDPLFRGRIHDEARAAATLSHPNVAQVYDFGESTEGGECVPYVVMELVTGGTLGQRLAAGPVPTKLAFRICAEVAAALAAAHAEGLVHRDVKPANVMLTPAGAKVVDFGIAAATRPARSTEPDSELFGTPAYLAPERLTGDAVEPASDVYALGVLLYRLLVGQLPWSAETSTGMVAAQVTIDPAPLPELPNVPGEVADLCRRCMDREPANRPTARQVATALARAAGAGPVDDELTEAVATPAPAGKPRTGPVRGAAAGAGATGAVGRRRRVRFVVVAAAGVVAAGTASWLYWVGDTDRPGSGQAAHLPLHSAQQVPVSQPGAQAPTSSTTPGTPGSRQTPGNSGNPAPPPGTLPPSAGSPRAPIPTSTAPAPKPTQPQPRTFTSAGGTVEAVCTADGLARLLSWAPVKPYKVERVDAGPATSATAVFRHGNSTVQMIITCADGVPSATTIPPGG
jgi:serine/threonine-protein kinase